MSTFTFGAQTPKPQTSAFGSTPFNFGQTTTAPATTTSSGFAFGQGFGTNTTTNMFATPLFNFGPTTTTAASAATTAPTFSFGPGLGTTTGIGTTGLFNQPTTGFGQTTAPFSSVNMFNQPRQQFTFGSALTQPQMQQQQLASQPTTTAQLFAPKLFNDERDTVLGHFNRLQASWGTGKMYYAINTPPFEVNQQQATHRFKAIGFAEIRKPGDDGDDNKFGVMVKMESDEGQLKTAILQYENNMKNMLGQQFNVKVETTKVLPDSKALLTISAVDTTTNKKVAAQQLVSYLNQQHVKSQLTAAFLNTFIQLIPLHPPSKQELEEYLSNPPLGIDPLLWDQAKSENPDPTKFIPVPLIGFAALNERFKLQEQETQQQKLRLKLISDELQNLERDVTVMKAKIAECKRRNVALSNRVLKVMIWQEVMRKRGFPIQAEEDQFRAKLENIQSEINAPTKFKGCLNELMCRLRQLQSQQQQNPTFIVEESVLKQIKTHLQQEQEGICHLLSLLKQDMSDLKSFQETEKNKKV
ncbi:nuclear pore complex protein Nup54-like protein [Leptotrombidium deliense]|uniref:Nuclear pore complex protein Nup54-like protein n=1 Tax=Leptotrombidium deliense TaxID=299467 RepID=A0A443SCX1_9ACAR|nr:nuclear pore complex protein Nup54-like protein [Leptotrombidium deliense]